jgi:hypothetical protein
MEHLYLQQPVIITFISLFTVRTALYATFTTNKPACRNGLWNQLRTCGLQWAHMNHKDAWPTNPPPPNGGFPSGLQN